MALSVWIGTGSSAQDSAVSKEEKYARTSRLKVSALCDFGVVCNPASNDGSGYHRNGRSVVL